MENGVKWKIEWKIGSVLTFDTGDARRRAINCRRISQNFSPARVTSPFVTRGEAGGRQRVRRTGQRIDAATVASDPFTCELRPRVCPIFSKAAAMSAVRFLKERRPHLPLRLRARQIPG